MIDGPLIASVASLIGDPARANMLTALMDGRALTVSELAHAGGVSLQTASGHLSRLDQAGLLTAEKQGRHRYFRLSGADVAAVLEGLMGLAQRTGSVPVRTGPRDPQLRTARVCYDHLAGAQAVALMQSLVAQGYLAGEAPDDLDITEAGKAFMAELGIDVGQLSRARRHLCRPCLDWSERKSHLGGALGAAVLDHILSQQWASRGEGRVVTFTPAGARDFATCFHIT